MTEPCDNSFGGIITLEAGDLRLAVRGEISMQPGNIEVAADAHHDGTPFFTAKPVLPGFQCNFSHIHEGTWDERMRRCNLNVTITERDNGRTHLFTGCRLVGRVSVNLTTGEVSGLSGSGGKYRPGRI